LTGRAVPVRLSTEQFVAAYFVVPTMRQARAMAYHVHRGEVDLVHHMMTNGEMNEYRPRWSIPPTPEVWAELAQHEMAGDHPFGKGCPVLEGRHRPEFPRGAIGIKVDYADSLLNHARKMKRGTIRVVVSEKNDGRETASNQAHHYRYVLDDDLTPETRHYVETVIAKFRTVNPDIPIKAANAQGAQDSHEREIKPEPAQFTNPDYEWAWTHNGGECS
jgi:hypothetical protein